MDNSLIKPNTRNRGLDRDKYELMRLSKTFVQVAQFV